MDAQTASGARISVPEDGRGILTIKAPRLEHALHCCCLITNAAMEHHNCEVVSNGLFNGLSTVLCVQVVPCGVTVAYVPPTPCKTWD